MIFLFYKKFEPVEKLNLNPTLSASFHLLSHIFHIILITYIILCLIFLFNLSQLRIKHVVLVCACIILFSNYYEVHIHKIIIIIKIKKRTYIPNKLKRKIQKK